MLVGRFTRGGSHLEARLTVGAVVGSIHDLFVKIAAIDTKHGKFDFVLCIGA